MTSTYLVCRRSVWQVLIPADHVLGVREMQVHAAPPTAPDWVCGLAFTDDAAVVVVAIDERVVAGAGERRVVLLRPPQDSGESLCGVLVDEVLALREMPSPDNGVVGAGGWSTRRDGEDFVWVDCDALRASLHEGAAR